MYSEQFESTASSQFTSRRKTFKGERGFITDQNDLTGISRSFKTKCQKGLWTGAQLNDILPNSLTSNSWKEHEDDQTNKHEGVNLSVLAESCPDHCYFRITVGSVRFKGYLFEEL
ncbi:hypothetical protein pdam_00017357, partial [Pocillopora damicornis]